jgi:hypothetical protein
MEVSGGKTRRKDHLKDQYVGGWIILNWILERWEWGGMD